MRPNESLAIRLANEVGATQYSTPPMRAVTGRSFTWEQLEKFVELAVKEEREACAEICEEVLINRTTLAGAIIRETSAAIRARSKP